ncbi:MAG TPA: hypothetical protein VFY68_01555 [Nitrososphaeraceae archaeon]|nr:hypothetical protein [Nitrososphaeraceae archaeon]
MKAHTIEKLLGRALQAQNVRSPLTKGVRRHEYKATHGLRKFFINAADSAGMKYLHIEYLMGHDIGITGNYRRFQEQKLLNDYLKAVAFLTISSQKTTQLQQQVAQLTVKNEEQKHVIERKLAEKEKESQETKKALEEIKAKHEDTKKELQQLIDNRQVQFEKYMTDILEARLKLVSPAYVYSSDKAFRKAVKKQVLEKDDKIKRSLRSTNNNTLIE